MNRYGFKIGMISSLLLGASCAQHVYRTPAGMHDAAPPGGEALLKSGEEELVSQNDFSIINYSDIPATTLLYEHNGVDHDVVVRLTPPKGVLCWVSGISGSTEFGEKLDSSKELSFNLGRDSKLFCKVNDARAGEVVKVTARAFATRFKVVDNDPVETKQSELFELQRRFRDRDFSDRGARKLFAEKGYLSPTKVAEIDTTKSRYTELKGVTSQQIAYFSMSGNLTISVSDPMIHGVKEEQVGPQGLPDTSPLNESLKNAKIKGWEKYPLFATICFIGKWEETEIRTPFSATPKKVMTLVRGEVVSVGDDSRAVEFKNEGNVYCEVNVKDASREIGLKGLTMKGGPRIGVETVNTREGLKKVNDLVDELRSSHAALLKGQEKMANDAFHASVLNDFTSNSRKSAAAVVAFERRKSDDMAAARLSRIRAGEEHISTKNAFDSNLNFSAQKIAHTFMVRPERVEVKEENGTIGYYTDYVVDEGKGHYRTADSKYNLALSEAIWKDSTRIISRDPYKQNASPFPVSVCADRIEEFRRVVERLTQKPTDADIAANQTLAANWPPTGDAIKKSLFAFEAKESGNSCSGNPKNQMDIAFKRVPEYQFCYNVGATDALAANGRAVVKKLVYSLSYVVATFKSEQLPKEVIRRRYGTVNPPDWSDFLFKSDQEVEAIGKAQKIQLVEIGQKIPGKLKATDLNEVPGEICVSTPFVRPTPELDEIEAKIRETYAKPQTPKTASQ